VPLCASEQRPLPFRDKVKIVSGVNFATPSQTPSENKKGIAMNLSVSLAPIVSLLAGILILVAPRMLNYIVAIYLIVIGLIGLFGAGHLRI